MLCVLILYISGGTCSSNLTPKDKFLDTFHGNFITLRVFARNLLRGNRQRNTFCILFWGSNSGFTANKPTHFLHGDYNLLLTIENRRSLVSSVLVY